MGSIIQVGDAPGILKAHLNVAELYSRMLGPKMCDELVALVQHMFTEEEAEVVQHMRPFLPKTAAGLAKASGRTLEQIKPTLQSLAHEKYILISAGSGRREVFTMLPILPGTFESVLVRKSADSATEWHRRFAELFEALYRTGYLTDLFKRPVDAVRYLPVGEVIENEPMALPSDHLKAVLERFDKFSIGVCQCRLSKTLIGEGCGRMLETCTVMGPLAPMLVQQGRMTQASRKDVLEVKAAAEKDGLITWMMNAEGGRLGNISCSCCGCCCGALRTISEFNALGFIAPPHFMPELNPALCNLCGKCVESCQMKALFMIGDDQAKTLVHESERCIGCGLCAVACPSDVLSMKPVPDYKEPPGGWLSYTARYGLNYIRNHMRVLSERRRG